jgi:hypothetical protein
MGSLRERIAAYANASAQLLVQLEELDRLRERVRQAQLPPGTLTRLKGPSIKGERANEMPLR